MKIPSKMAVIAVISALSFVALADNNNFRGGQNTPIYDTYFQHISPMSNVQNTQTSPMNDFYHSNQAMTAQQALMMHRRLSEMEAHMQKVEFLLQQLVDKK